MRIRLALIAVLLGALALSGCTYVEGLLGLLPDFAVTGIDVTTDSSGNPATLTITFANNGGQGGTAIKYAVVLTKDGAVSVGSSTTPTIYSSTVDLPANARKTVTLSIANDIDPYISSHSSSFTSTGTANYYFGAMVNSDTGTQESDTSNNTGHSANQYPFSTSSASALAAPGGFTADTSYSGEIYLYWNTVTGASSYNLYRDTSSSFSNKTLLTPVLYDSSYDQYYYDDYAVTSGQTYYYEVQAVDSSGNGGAFAPSGAAVAP